MCAYAGDVNEFIDFGFSFTEWLDGYLDGDEPIANFFACAGDLPSYFESDLVSTD